MKKGKSKNNGILPNSLRIISSCIKTVSNNASSVASTVRSSVAASITASSEDHKDQVTWAGFDRLEFGPSNFKHVLLLGYQNGFQVFDVEDAANFIELVSKRDGPVSFLQMQPFPASSNDQEGFKSSHPLLLVVAGDDTNSFHPNQNCTSLGATRRDGNTENLSGNCVSSPTSVRFYSLRSHCYVHILRFRSTVHVVRCSPQIIAVGLASQIYCIDALTLENKFSVLTYPVLKLGGQGTTGVNVGYGPMAVGRRWLAYACNNPLIPKTSRLSPQNFCPSSGASPSTSPGGSTLVARCAMESGKQLAAGIINLGDMGYKTLSKYCQELLPDGSSSPVPSTSGWKVGRHPGSDCENAGMVAIKDFNTRAIISQFKAHTSPISALCFDPSGTLLVTASVYGNNINIFRIMPSRNVPGVQSYDISSSHVHLYKLHRGITSAMIQDICFSHYSQWIAIVSSKGTCHVFYLSPFSGDSGLQSLSSSSDKPSLYILSSPPWWSSSSFMINQYISPPPPPVSLSVVSRIKYSSFGWINTINSATGSTTGKVFVPSGAVAAVFHNSMSQSVQVMNSRANLLAHLLVYTPSGHVVQHELLPSIGPQLGENDLRTRSSSFVHVEEEDLTVEVKPVQWWDVCRRSDWQEREDCVLGKTDGNGVQVIQNKAGCEVNLMMDYLNISENNGVKTMSVKPHDRLHLYLSNAEVQIGSGRLAVWQKSKICFYFMDSSMAGNCGGEFEIEKLPGHEVEIKQKELLPVFDHFHSIRSASSDRGVAAARHSQSPSLESHQSGKETQETVICHSMPASSTESSECGSSRRIEHLLDLDQMNCEKPFKSACQMFDDFYLERSGGIIAESPLLNKSSILKSPPSEMQKTPNADIGDPNENGWCTTQEYLLSTGKTHGREYQKSLSMDFNEASCALTLTGESRGSDTEILVGGPIVQADNSAESWICFQEGHGGALEFAECCQTTKVSANDVDNSNSHYKKEKPDEDAENDEFLGGMFSFSE